MSKENVPNTKFPPDSSKKEKRDRGEDTVDTES